VSERERKGKQRIGSMTRVLGLSQRYPTKNPRRCDGQNMRAAISGSRLINAVFRPSPPWKNIMRSFSTRQSGSPPGVGSSGADFRSSLNYVYHVLAYRLLFLLVVSSFDAYHANVVIEMFSG
jgi:hypothetical protein